MQKEFKFSFLPYDAVPKSWETELTPRLDSSRMHALDCFLAEEIISYSIYPEKKNIFRALTLTELDAVKSIIIGQDPYHEPGQAHGLAFSVPRNEKIPPSLKNIYKELAASAGFVSPPHGELISWAQQGVLLINSILTVRAGCAHSHAERGWEHFTDTIITVLNEQKKNLVFFLWGKAAQKKIQLIDESRHLILTAPHPSPLSAWQGFLGCRHFLRAEEYMKKKGIIPINWRIYDAHG